MLSDGNGSYYLRAIVFQYPLFRIELLSESTCVDYYFDLEFQYPLFRIELLSLRDALKLPAKL